MDTSPSVSGTDHHDVSVSSLMTQCQTRQRSFTQVSQLFFLGKVSHLD